MKSQAPQIESVLAAAVEIGSDADRREFVDQACAGDAELKRRVEELIENHFRAGSFLESPAAGSPSCVMGEGQSERAVVTVDEVPITEGPGTVIGPYKLLQQIGEGGFGVVFMAEQTHPVQRKVALKVIKPGMDSRQVIARFEAERQALALMDHVNIARVFDAGATENGRPYFVMELVHGVPITKYCDDNRLTPRQRLELFVPVCQAIQHAHQKGIIHRDVKPSNVMITLYDGKPVPKVIDFGVAKATEQRLTERTLFTQYGTMVGTFEYMSPEQAEMSALGVDTRSDIYSLGVLLYELLTGNTPLTHKRMKEAAYAEILRMIREEEAPKPSTRLSDSGEALASISANRHMEPAKLTKLVRGELDWIVMKTLEKDRNRRYETANGFAQDVLRYLADEPVQACPPSAAYRFRKFARRNKRALLAASALALTILLALVGLAVSNVLITQEKNQKVAALHQAKANEEIARENLEHALAAIDQMLLRVGHESLANLPQTKAVRRELLEDALKFYEKLLEKRPEHRLTREGLAMAHLRLANLLEPAEAEPHHRKGFAMFDALAAEEPLDPDTRRVLIWRRGKFAEQLWTLGKKAEGDEQIRAAVKMGEELVSQFPDTVEYTNALAGANVRLAQKIAPTQPEEAERILRRNLAITTGPYPLAQTHQELGKLAWTKGRFEEAEQAFRKAVEFQEKVVPSRANERAMRGHLFTSLQKLGQALIANKRLQEAEEVYCRVALLWDKLAAEEPGIEENLIEQAHAHQVHAEILAKLNLPAEAERAHRRSLEAILKLAAEFPTVAKHQQAAFDRCLWRGRLLLKDGRLDEARELFTKAEIFLERIDADLTTRFKHWQELAQTHIDIAGRWRARAKAEDAEPAFRKMIAILDKLEAEYSGQEEHRYDLAVRHLSASWILNGAGRFEDTVRLARRALAHAKAARDRVADESARRILAGSHHVLGRNLNRLGRPNDAEVELRAALPIYEQLANEFPTLTVHRISLATAHHDLGWVLRRRNEGLAAAETEHRRALALHEELSKELPDDAFRQSDRAESLHTIGVLRRIRGDLTEAKSLLEQAMIYAEKACDLDPNRQVFRDRLENTRRELATTLKAQKPEKKDTPK